MAAVDAKPVPVRGQAFRVTCPLFDSTGAPVLNPAGLDSEVSIDGAGFADCASEAFHIGHGVVYLDLTGAEMDGDTVVVVISSSTVDCKPAILIMYPQEPGDIPVRLDSAGQTLLIEQFFKLDLSTISGEAARSWLNALRPLINRWRRSGSSFVVYKENDEDVAWSGSVEVGEDSVEINPG